MPGRGLRRTCRAGPVMDRAARWRQVSERGFRLEPRWRSCGSPQGEGLQLRNRFDERRPARRTGEGRSGCASRASAVVSTGESLPAAAWRQGGSTPHASRREETGRLRERRNSKRPLSVQSGRAPFAAGRRAWRARCLPARPAASRSRTHRDRRPAHPRLASWPCRRGSAGRRGAADDRQAARARQGRDRGALRPSGRRCCRRRFRGHRDSNCAYARTGTRRRGRRSSRESGDTVRGSSRARAASLRPTARPCRAPVSAAPRCRWTRRTAQVRGQGESAQGGREAGHRGGDPGSGLAVTLRCGRGGRCIRRSGHAGVRRDRRRRRCAAGPRPARCRALALSSRPDRPCGIRRRDG